ncbi:MULTISPECIES: aminoglycoside phosphotransferase family protein [Paenibacillus]|uniref:aminoglycoside phosphotransferase family protein n=1 Tax=Paenibacillus TaxID=44249 RepID=UPI00048F70EE|nr:MULTISPECIES: phosphotransferase family protein [Paenibacillus]SMF00700.1 Predicted kinase, aminoglycoside phosphotransferase (APT) family [Paenibacillus barengoltzii]
MFADIQGYETFKKIDPITKGWSSDQKYYIETVTNERWLLRIADISQYDHKKHEFEMMRRLAESGIPMSRPVDFGVCNNGQSVYSLSTWCDGEDAQAVLPKLTDTRQYHLGVTAGQILRQIHSIPAPVDQEPWESSFNRKVDRKIKQYHDCGVKMVGDEQIIAYIEANRHYLSERPQCFQHGDYHVGNMIISPEGELWIIDFNRWDYGDPWEEFNRIVWSAKVSPHFATGQIHGYFHGNPPDEFFTLLVLYIGTNALSSIPWAIPFGEVEVAVMQQQARDVLTWFDGMRNPVPAWYLSDFKSSI